MSQVPDERVGRRQSGAVVENHAFFWGKQLSQSNSGQTHLGGKKHTFSVFYCFRESLRCNNLGLEVGEATNEVQQFLAEWTAHVFSQHASWPSCWWQTVANLPILPFLILVASSGILYFPHVQAKNKQLTPKSAGFNISRLTQIPPVSRWHPFASVPRQRLRRAAEGPLWTLSQAVQRPGYSWCIHGQY